MGLIIRKDSWHYRLHSLIRRLWGCPPSPKERWSLCPYFHTNLWGTAVTVVLLLPVLIGWLFARGLRKAYKIGNANFLLSWFSRICDATPLGRSLDKAPSRFSSSFMWSGISWFVGTLFVLVTFFAAVLLLRMMIIHGFAIIPLIPGAIWQALLWAGWGIFHAFFGLGWFFSQVAHGAVWLGYWFIEAIPAAFFAVVEFLSSSAFWAVIWTIVWQGAIGILGLALVGLFTFWTYNAPVVTRFCNWFEMKANGYAEARTAREKAMREKLHQAAIKEDHAFDGNSPDANFDSSKKPDREFDGFWNIVAGLATVMESLETFIKIVWEAAVVVWEVFFAIMDWFKSLYSEEVYRNGEWQEQLGPIGVVFKGIWAMKKGVCPMLEFVDDKQPEPPAKPE